jgi:hypothetical protein
MALEQAKANPSRVTQPHSRSAPDYQIDEALWAAYRRYDKSAVTEKLLRRYLPGLASILELNGTPDPGRKSVRNEMNSGRERSENRSGRKNFNQTFDTSENFLRVPGEIYSIERQAKALET